MSRLNCLLIIHVLNYPSCFITGWLVVYFMSHLLASFTTTFSAVNTERKWHIRCAIFETFLVRNHVLNFEKPCRRQKNKKTTKTKSPFMAVVQNISHMRIYFKSRIITYLLPDVIITELYTISICAKRKSCNTEFIYIKFLMINRN